MDLAHLTMQKNTKTQTLKDTEINLKKATLHGSYNIYKKNQKIRLNINRKNTQKNRKKNY